MHVLYAVDLCLSAHEACCVELKPGQKHSHMMSLDVITVYVYNVMCIYIYTYLLYISVTS